MGLKRLCGFLLCSIGLCLPIQALAADSTYLLDKVVAVVGDTLLLHSELEKALLADEEWVRMQGKLSRSQASAIRRRVLESMIDKTLLLAQAGRLQQSVSERELDQVLEKTAEANQMTLDDLKAAVESSGYFSSWQVYRDEMREQTLLYKLEGILAQGSGGTVSEQDVRKRYRELSQGEGARAEVEEITIPVAEDDFETRYMQAEALLRQLREGASGEELADAGQLRWQAREVRQGKIAPALDEAIFAAQQGDVLGPIKTAQGLVIMKVLSMEASELRDFEASKEELSRQLEMEARDKALARIYRQLRSRTHIEIRLAH